MPRSARPTALTMPCVTVWLSPNGLPRASTTSATSTRLLSASATTGYPAPGSFSTARSVFGSVPTSRAETSRRSASVTRMSCAPSTTWLLVRTNPSAVTMTPEPSPRSRRGGRLPKNRREKGSSGSFAVRAVATFTTAGSAAFAAAVHPGGGDALGGASTTATRGVRWNGHHQCRRSAPGPMRYHASTIPRIQKISCAAGL